MTDWSEIEAEAESLLAAGRQAQALRVLRDALAAGDDLELRREVHRLASTAHEAAHGFDKIEWHRLMLDTEPAPVG